MSRLFFFYCKNCDNKFPLYEQQLGWIDKFGKIGYHLTIDLMPNHEAIGNFDFITINDAICVECNIIYSLIHLSKTQAQDLTLVDDDLNRIIISDEEIEINDNKFPEYKIYKTNVKCQKCNGQLFTGSQLVERSLIKKESKLLGIQPDDTIVDQVIDCPNCKKAKLEFDYAIRYH
ncbi:MAG: hypothetical protein FK734_07260 [Asgard group archaeon]|nr:hypothetical protein [Asgard group archaeon]